MKLTVDDHDRDKAGLTYVYPVVSRRARGVSVGINLNTNNACNWRCVYCQVPGLVFGKAPAVDLDLLEDELRGLLTPIVRGDWMERHVPEGSRRLNDVAFSGNGEPTTSPAFEEAVERVERVLGELELLGEIQVVLITNGSLMGRASVQRGLARLARLNGRVWFKLDAATDAGQERLNSNRAGVARSLENLELAAGLCPTWVQTMAMDWNGPTLGGKDGAAGDEATEAYLALLAQALERGVELEGVLLYGLARPSHQPEAGELRALPLERLESLAERIRALGLEVTVSA